MLRGHERAKERLYLLRAFRRNMMGAATSIPHPGSEPYPRASPPLFQDPKGIDPAPTTCGGRRPSRGPTRDPSIPPVIE